MSAGGKTEIEASVHREQEEEDKVVQQELEDGDAGSLTKGKRSRQMTERGRAYTKGIKKSRLKQLCSGLEKNMSFILDMMDGGATVYRVHEYFKVWQGLFESFLEVDIAYRDLLSDEELDDYESDWFESRNTVMIDFKPITLIVIKLFI